MPPSSAPPSFPSRDTAVPVSEFNRRVRGLVESSIPLQWVSGEISNLTFAASGHVYFSLKDAQAQIRCVLFRSRAQLVGWRLANGQAVEVRALASFYEPRGEFQLSVDAVRKAGVGDLFERFLRLKTKLEAEGLFATARKRALPPYPRRIDVITSPQAAALRDVVAAVGRRAAHVQLVLHPVLVQGPEAAGQIAAALARADRLDDCELILLCRGGGSLEDLWPFNDESVARAIAACAHPVIAGIGHETDFTIADFVADVRAATPTAAAELATQAWSDARARLGDLGRRLRQRLDRLVESRRQQLDYLQRRLRHPRERIEQFRSRLAELTRRMTRSARQQQDATTARLDRLAHRLDAARPPIDRARERTDQLRVRLTAAASAVQRQRRNRLALAETALRQLNPSAVLTRGYALVRRRDGHLVTDARAMKPGEKIVVHWTRGEADATVDAVRIPLDD